MKTKDFLIVALAPMPVRMIPLVAMQFTKEVNWTWHDIVFAWVAIARATFVSRLLATRKRAHFAYRAGAGLAVAADFLLTWINLAGQIIGDKNPANLLYLSVILTGLTGTGLARSRPSGMARAAFATAAATFLVPVIAFLAWPTDCSPGVPQIFLLNGCFAAFLPGSHLILGCGRAKFLLLSATV